MRYLSQYIFSLKRIETVYIRYYPSVGSCFHSMNYVMVHDQLYRTDVQKLYRIYLEALRV